jgi:hypothetical protein
MRLATTKTREEATTNKSVREPIEGKRASVMSSVELNPLFHKSFIKVKHGQCRLRARLLLQRRPWRSAGVFTHNEVYPSEPTTEPRINAGQPATANPSSLAPLFQAIFWT